MTASEFMNSLKVTFEILNTTELNASQLCVIKKNLKEVFQDSPSESSSFCNWLQGYFDLENPKTLKAETGVIIQNKLQDVLSKKVVNKKEVKPRFEAMC